MESTNKNQKIQTHTKKKQKNNQKTLFLLFSAILAVSLLFVFVHQIDIPVEIPKEKIDDWKYDPTDMSNQGNSLIRSIPSIAKNIGARNFAAESVADVSSKAGSSNLGFSVGGAKDINNFRENINNDYLPTITDITYEGLFYDYYFDTNTQQKCKELFCPSYSYAITEDPMSNVEEYYLSVGLNSNIKESDFKRKKLNLVVVLDISGSMSSPFNRYYYDQRNRGIPIPTPNPIEGHVGCKKNEFGEFDKECKGKVYEEDEDAGKSKMEIASKSVVSLLSHLEDDDRFAMVLFNNGAATAKPFREIEYTDMDEIEEHILDIFANGGTNMEAGYKEGTMLFDDLNSKEMNPNEYENRIIFLTDAMPNLGQLDKRSLLGMTKNNAKDSIHTSFIGIGVDFNTELIEHITKIRGANYYSVHSSSEFKNRMDDEFEFMVTPLVFDLNLELDTTGFEIEKVFGSPEANEATGEIMKVNTLFPSKQVDGETKGGIVLLKLRKTALSSSPKDSILKLKVSYEDRNGDKHSNEEEIEFKQSSSSFFNSQENYDSLEFFENSGIRKGILLTRYTNLIKNWIIDERKAYSSTTPIHAAVNNEDGIILPPDFPPDYQLSKWERQSVSLRVSPHYKTLFQEFAEHFEDEMVDLNDNSLQQELDILELLSDY